MSSSIGALLRERWDISGRNPVDICPGAWHRTDNMGWKGRRLTICLTSRFFRYRGMEVWRSCVKSLVKDIFMIDQNDIMHAHRPILCVWTTCEEDILLLLKRGVSFLKSDMREGRRLVKILEWLTALKVTVQMRAKYDPKARGLYTTEVIRGRKKPKIIRSPKLLRHTLGRTP